MTAIESKRLRVLVLHNYYRQRGGEDTEVEGEVAMLRSAGHEVEFHTVTNEEIKSVLDELKAFAETPYSASRANWIRGTIDRFRPNIVHVHNFFPLLTPAVHAAAASRGVAVVQTLQNFRLFCAGAMLTRNGQVCEKCLGGNNLWGVVHRCYRNSLPGSLAVVRMQSRAKRSGIWHRDVHRFIALTEFARQKFIEGGLPAERIAIKPNMIRAQINVSPSERAHSQRILFVGRLSSEKGVDVLIKAARLLPNAQVTIIGDGPERERLAALAGPNITFLGELSHEAVMAEMADARALVVPSTWYEGLPLTVVEAFSASLPVIASDIGSLGEIVIEGTNGYLFKAGDVLGLKAKLEHMLQSAEMVLQVAEGAARTYIETYSPETNLQQLESIYQGAISQAGASAS